MPIKVLKNKLNESGKIKIGRKGAETTTQTGKTFRAPSRIDHFIITTTQKDERGDFVEDESLMVSLKKSGGLSNKDGNLIGIPIRLLYNDTDLNFATRLNCYIGGTLACWGDGEKAFKKLTNWEKEYKCPCVRFEPGYKGNDICKAAGTLTCIIDQANFFGQVHKFRTTSINSIQSITGSIELIKRVTGGRIAGLPLMLGVNNKTTTIPGTGKQTTIQVVSVYYRGSAADLRKETLQIVQEERQYMIELKDIEECLLTENAGAGPDGDSFFESPEEEKDFVEEFIPEAAAANGHGDSGHVEPTQPAKQDEAATHEPKPPMVENPTQDETEKDLAEEAVVSPAIDGARDTEKEIMEKVISMINEGGDAAPVVTNCSRLRLPVLEAFAADVLFPELEYEILPKQKKEYYLRQIEVCIGKKHGMFAAGSPIAKELQKEQQPQESHEPPAIDAHKTPGSPQGASTEIQALSTHPDYFYACGYLYQPKLVSYLRGRFKGHPINGTLPMEDLLKQAAKLFNQELEKQTQSQEDEPQSGQQPGENAPDTTTDDIPEAFDDHSGPATITQLREIARLKGALRIVSAELWDRLVTQFKDPEGNPLESAKLMTAAQAEIFKAGLFAAIEAQTPVDQIVFDN